MPQRVRRGKFRTKGVSFPVQVVVGGETLLTRENAAFSGCGLTVLLDSTRVLHGYVHPIRTDLTE